MLQTILRKMENVDLYIIRWHTFDISLCCWGFDGYTACAFVTNTKEVEEPIVVPLVCVLLIVATKNAMQGHTRNPEAMAKTSMVMKHPVLN